MIRRARSRLLDAAAIFSLLLCVAAIALWVRSYVVTDWVQCSQSRDLGNRAIEVNQYDFSSGLGGFAFEWGTTEYPGMSGQPGDGRYHVTVLQTMRSYGGAGFRVPGFHWFMGFAERSCRDSVTPRNYGFQIIIPWPAIVIALGVLPFFRIRHRLRIRRENDRAARGLCIACGYDLRATSDRCPECGTVAARR